jgi:hypothetical protein
MTLRKNMLLLAIVVMPFFNAIAQKQPNSKKFRLLTYGLPDWDRENASTIVQNKWGIEYHAVAGCMVNQGLEDSVKKENDKVEKLIETKYGKNWWKKFDTEIEAEYNIETQIDSLIRRQTFISSKEIVNPWPGSLFPMHPIDKKGNYLVMVNNYNKDWEEQKLYILKVNYKANTIKIVNDYTEGK